MNTPVSAIMGRKVSEMTMRSEKEYENVVLHIEWMHLEPGAE